MKRTLQIILILCGLLVESSVSAEHQTYLRGIVNVPGLQIALLEIQHTLVKPTNAPPVIITTSRLARAREQFEDQTIKGGHFQFEVLEIDFARETVKTREAGEEHSYSLPATDRPSTAKSWLHLHNAAFSDMIDLYSSLENRVLLLHPVIDRAPVSVEATWTNRAPEKAEAADALGKYLKQRGISVVVDGTKFMQLLPSALTQAASPRSKELAAGPDEIGGGHFSNPDLGNLAEMYASLSGRRCTGNQGVGVSVPYLNISQPLSKPEMLYVFETLFAWNHAAVLLGDDNTFSIVPAPR
jgi:hypothetical protein